MNILLILYSVNWRVYFGGGYFLLANKFIQFADHRQWNISFHFCFTNLILFLICFIDSTNWASGEDDHVVARAEYDFVAVSEEEISFRAGDMLNLALKGNKTYSIGITCAFLKFVNLGVPAVVRWVNNLVYLSGSASLIPSLVQRVNDLAYLSGSASLIPSLVQRV